MNLTTVANARIEVSPMKAPPPAQPATRRLGEGTAADRAARSLLGDLDTDEAEMSRDETLY